MAKSQILQGEIINRVCSEPVSLPEPSTSGYFLKMVLIVFNTLSMSLCGLQSINGPPDPRLAEKFDPLEVSITVQDVFSFCPSNTQRTAIFSCREPSTNIHQLEHDIKIGTSWEGPSLGDGGMAQLTQRPHVLECASKGRRADQLPLQQITNFAYGPKQLHPSLDAAQWVRNFRT